MSKSKNTVYFLMSLVVLALVTIIITLNMDRLIPDFLGELFTYRNEYINGNRRSEEASVSDIIWGHMNDENVYRISNLEEYIEDEIIKGILNYALTYSADEIADIRTGNLIFGSIFRRRN